jgi:hypothetical protein
MRYLQILFVFAALIAGIAGLQRIEWITDSQASSLLVALVPLLGVLLTLNWSQRQFEESLREERERAATNRRLVAKQGAFIEAAESIISFIGYLSTLPDRALPQDGEIPKEVQSFSPSLSKLHFFSDLETIELAIRLNRLLMESYVEVLQAKIPSSFTINDIKDVDLQIANLEKQVDQIREEMLAVLKIDPNHGLLLIQRNARAEALKALAAHHANKGTLIDRKFQETEACRDVVMRRLKTVHAAITEIFLSARRELSFPIDGDRYQQLMNAESAAMMTKLDAMLAEFRKKVAEKIASP